MIDGLSDDRSSPFLAAVPRATRGEPQRQNVVRPVGGSGDTQASRLLRLAKSTWTFHLSDAGEAFAVPRLGPRTALIINGDAGAFRRSLARAYADKFQQAPSAQALSDVTRVLHGEAEERPPEALPVRVAGDARSVVVDLGTPSGEAVVVQPGAWEVVSRSPVPFRRTRGLTGALPSPVRDGSIDDLAYLCGLDPDSAQFHLITGWAIAALVPDIAHPVLLLRGGQGSGKSTLARMLVDLIDPSPASIRSLPPVADWHNTVKSSYVIGLDNVTSLTQEQTNHICTAVTGDAYVKRALYTDDGTNVTAFRRPVVMTSIGLTGLRGDLADRLLPLDLPVIPEKQRRAERDMWEEYRDIRPGLVGQLLTGLASAMSRLPEVKGDLRSRPRLADFYEVLSALDAATEGDSYARAYDALGGDLAQEVVDSDAFIAGIQSLMQSPTTSHGIGRHAWQGSVSDLLEKIKPVPTPRDWPKTASSASQRLAHAIPALRAVGISVERSRNKRGSFVLLDTEIR